MRLSNRVFATFVSSALAVCCALPACGPGAGFLGLQDYGRDILFNLGGALAGALLADRLPDLNGNDNTGRDQPGPPGPRGEEGPPGPPIFATYVDTFFSAEEGDVLGVRPVRNDEAALGNDQTPVAFSVSIPSNYDGGNPILMRVVVFRDGPCEGGCLIMTIDARRAQLGDTEPQCFGGDEDDCSDGTRYVRVQNACAGAENQDNAEQFMLIDLPLNDAGLDYPDIEAGDILAFELATLAHDGGTFHLLGVEFSDADASPVATGTVFLSRDDVPEACVRNVNE